MEKISQLFVKKQRKFLFHWHFNLLNAHIKVFEIPSIYLTKLVNVSSSLSPTPLVVMATPRSSIMVPIETSAVGKITPSSASILKASMMSSMATNAPTDDRNASNGIKFTLTK